jgi:hypothetical protein
VAVTYDYKDVANSLAEAFLWRESRQGVDFWEKVAEAFRSLDDLEVIADFILRAANEHPWSNDITTVIDGRTALTGFFNHPEGVRHDWYLSLVCAFMTKRFDEYIDDMIRELRVRDDTA